MPQRPALEHAPPALGRTMAASDAATRRRWLQALALMLVQMGPGVAEAKTDPLLWFKMKTGIVDVVKPPQAGPGLVLTAWPRAHDVLGVNAGWSIDADFFYFPNHRGAARRYAARKDEQTCEVELYLCADGFNGAVDRMVEIATGTMLPYPPYSKAPDDVRFGELALISDDPACRTLIFTFRNLCIKVETSAGGEHTVALARRMKAIAARQVVAQDLFDKGRSRLSLPQSPLELVVGQKAILRPVARATAIMRLVALPENAMVAVLKQEPDELIVQAIQPGKTRVGVVLAETDTLRCDARSITCIVR